MTGHQKTHLIFCLTRVCERFLLCTPGITRRRRFLQFCLNWGMWDKTCNMFIPLVYFFKDSRPVLTSLRLRAVCLGRNGVLSLATPCDCGRCSSDMPWTRGTRLAGVTEQQGSLLSGGKGESSLLYTFITKCKLGCFTTRRSNLP